MTTSTPFNRIDHLMIEVEDPQAAYEDFYQVFGLPQAWPLMTSKKYSSIGINFGNTNVELISFSERFGIKNTQHSGLSGVCLTSHCDAENLKAHLNANALEFLDGENAETHHTWLINSKAAPTLFVCYYKFNTDGWKIRLQEEFKKSQGGTHHITQIAEVYINHPLLQKHEMSFSESSSAKLKFSQKPELRLQSADNSLTGKSIVICDTLFSFC